MSRVAASSHLITKPDDELLNVEQVADELGISRYTFYRWRCTRRGTDTPKLPNGQIRVGRSALESFLSACEHRL